MAKIVHQFVCPFYHSGFRGAAVEEAVADFEAERFGNHHPAVDFLQQVFRPVLTYGQRASEAFHNQIFAFDFAMGILSPKLHVGIPIGFIECFGMFEIVLKVENPEDFLQGDDGIAMRVVKRIVEVDEP